MHNAETQYSEPGTGNRTIAYCAVFFALTFVSRWLLADPMLYNIDSIHFAMALDKYDVSLHLPHPPGYFLYVMAGRLARVFTGDANSALILVNTFTSGILSALAYVAGKEFYGHREGIAAAVITMASPLVWFHGVVGLSYITEAVASLLVAYLCFRTLSGDVRMLWISAAVIGVSAGFRQSSMMFLLPLWLYSTKGLSIRRMLVASSVMIVSALAWFIPMVYASGGINDYISLLEAQVAYSVWEGLDIYNTVTYAAANLSFVVLGLFATLFPLLSAVLFRKNRPAGLTAYPAGPAFFMVWLLPSLAFYLVVFTQKIAPGYGLVYMPGLILLAGRATVNESVKLTRNKPDAQGWKTAVFAVMLAAIVSINSYFFLVSDNAFTLNWIGTHNNRTAAFIDTLRKNFPADETVLICKDNFFLSYRHAEYYAPEYLVYYVPGINGLDGRYFLKCINRTTEPVKNISVPVGTRRIVLFARFNFKFPEAIASLGGKQIYVNNEDYMVYYDYDNLVKNGIPVGEGLLPGL